MIKGTKAGNTVAVISAYADISYIYCSHLPFLDEEVHKQRGEEGHAKIDKTTSEEAC